MSSIKAQDIASSIANSARDSRVLCLFHDKTIARPFESALMDCGVSLLRARHGMHAYWLSIASEPVLMIIDARQMNPDILDLLSRVQANTRLADTAVWVIANEDLPITDSEQFAAIPGDILATNLAKRAHHLIVEKDRIQQQRVDEYFSLWDNAPATREFTPKPPYIRSDWTGDSRSKRNTHDSLRRSRVGN